MLCQLSREEGSTFSVTFLHSVNKSDVCETYCVEGGSIYVESCEYSAFGAGVAAQVEPGQTLTHTPDGHMLLSGIHREIPSLSYIVGTIYDHYLDIDGQTINLRSCAAKTAPFALPWYLNSVGRTKAICPTF